jgi:hypothetical protein
MIRREDEKIKGETILTRGYKIAKKKLPKRYKIAEKDLPRRSKMRC